MPTIASRRHIFFVNRVHLGNSVLLGYFLQNVSGQTASQRPSNTPERSGEKTFKRLKQCYKARLQTLNISWSTVQFIIQNWKEFGTTKTYHGHSHKPEVWARKVFICETTKKTHGNSGGAAEWKNQSTGQLR